MATIRSCPHCGREFHARAARLLCDDCRKVPGSRTPEAGEPLLPREQAVANLVAEACANKEIAFRLHLKEGTIKKYVSDIFRKLGVSSRLELARLVWSEKGLQ